MAFIAGLVFTVIEAIGESLLASEAAAETISTIASWAGEALYSEEGVALISEISDIPAAEINDFLAVPERPFFRPVVDTLKASGEVIGKTVAYTRAGIDGVKAGYNYVQSSGGETQEN